MLPKDLLKYAKQFSPEEAKRAIINAMKPKPAPTSHDDAFYQIPFTDQLGYITSISTSQSPYNFTTTDVTYTHRI